MATESELRAVLGRYPTDNRRRRRIAILATPLGAVAGCLGMLMMLLIAGNEPASAMVFPAFVTGFGLGALFAGLWQARLAATRTDEVFTLYQGGLGHAYAGTSWAVSWSDIAGVKDNGRDTAFQRALGLDVHYRVALRSPVGGRRSVTITGLTHDAVGLAEAVRQAASACSSPEVHGVNDVRRY
ncbi:hypothetical protein [Prauserella endophytica]|uniref:PH domain-containing protein n=1 Tax=Prauserella endophytica TaxID=1592324 RepID=A0ABY2SBQ7_9PSEU|nr:hypothetical protein [Prauserella endophytica]TKG72779.1 hypothetical protein FCN18_06005 [Prauserella endophytica]